jgi:hypothetical protein
MINFKQVLIVVILVSVFSGCIRQPASSETSVPTPTAATMVMTGPQQDASTSESIYLEPGAEKITIYVPVLLDKNKNVSKMYETPAIEGNVTTTIIDTEYGKALKISGSGLGNYLFNWNEIPGNDTDRFVKWLGDNFPIERPDIRKTDDWAIIASGKYPFAESTKVVYTFRLNQEKNKILYNVTGSDPYYPLFVTEENGKLNVYDGRCEIDTNETHGILKEDEQTSDEFFSEFTISMSNYTPPEHFTTMPIPESPPEIDAWVYSDSEIEKVRFYFYLDPRNRISGISLVIGTDGWVHLRKGWQVVNLTEILAVV